MEWFRSNVPQNLREHNDSQFTRTETPNYTCNSPVPPHQTTL